MNSATATQLKLEERLKNELGIEVDFGTYCITRGRGHAKIKGVCSSSVYGNFKGSSAKILFRLYAPLRDYLSNSKDIICYQSDCCYEYDLEIEKKGIYEKKIYTYNEVMHNIFGKG